MRRPIVSLRLEETGDAVVRELCRSDLEEIYQVRMLARDPAAAADAMFRHLDGTLSTLNVRCLGRSR